MIIDKHGRYYRVTAHGDSYRAHELLSDREVAFARLDPSGRSVAAVLVYRQALAANRHD
jgi:hypothetical protein